MKLPHARTAEIIEQDLGKELLIYDLQTNKAYTLNETLMKVYRACDGIQTLDDLKRKYRFTDDLIYLALDELQKNDLLDGYQSAHFAGLSRREVVRRVGLASMVALPVIAGIVAPTAVQAASVCQIEGQACTFTDNTQSDCCANLRCDFTSTCFDCNNTGVPYAGCIPQGDDPQTNETACTTTCNSDARKNLCCNEGEATAAPSFINGLYECRCP